MERLFNQDHLLRSVIEAVPSPLFIVNKNFEVVDHNNAGMAFLGPEAEILLMRLCGETFHCFNEKESKKM
jgi:PAS domain-containing protein